MSILNTDSSDVRPKLLVTARDPATAEAVRIFAEAVIKDGRLDIYIVSEMPATDVLVSIRGIQKDHLITFVSSRNEEDLMARARKVLSDVKPDIVLTGISGPDYGLDEAVLAVAPRTIHGPYAIQSYWGDVNEFFGSLAKTFLVLDDYAAKLTAERTGGRTVIIGSLKHEKYNEIDTLNLRSWYRQQIRVEDASPVIGFFGQPLEVGTGYRRAVCEFSGFVGECCSEYTLVYRPHPKESISQQEWTRQIFADCSIKLVIDPERRLEASLCGCDWVVSAFSTCGYDLQQLVNTSPAPLGVPVYLMINDQIRSYYYAFSKLREVPMADRDMAITVETFEELRSALDQNSIEEKKMSCWDSIKRNFPASSNSSSCLIDLLITDFEKEKEIC